MATEQKYESIDLKKAYVSNDPELKTITPTSGKHQGKETPLLEFNVGKPLITKEADGSFKDNGTKYYGVKVYGTEATQMARHLEKGMQVNVEGSKSTETWKDKATGDDKSRDVINASSVTLNLTQTRLSAITFDKQVEKGKEAATKEPDAKQPAAKAPKAAAPKKSEPER